MESTVRCLREIGTSLGEAVNVGFPFLCLGSEPIGGGLRIANESAEDTMTGGDVKAGAGGLGKVVGGAVKVVGRDYEDALLGVRIVTIKGANAGKLFEKGANVGIGASCIAIVCMPNVEADVVVL